MFDHKRIMKHFNLDELLDKFVDKKDGLESLEDIVDFTMGMDRQLSIADIDSEVGEAINSMIRFWNHVDDEECIPIEDRQPIKIYINSDGGDLDATFTMIDTIQNSITPVWTINIGKAYSGGFLTFIAGHKRIAYPHSSFLFHEGSTNYGENANKFIDYSSFYKKQLDAIKEHVLAKTKYTPKAYNSMRKDDAWIDAKEALKMGVCDEISKDLV